MNQPAPESLPGPAAAGPRWAGTVALAAFGIAVMVAAYVWVEERSGTGQRIVELRESLNTRSSEVAALGARLDELAGSRRRIDDDLDRLSDRLTRETGELSGLPDRVDQVEQTLQKFVGVGDKVRSAWLLAEAEHYLRIANAQLGLAGDVDVAQTSLGLADDTLRELNDPRLTPVRKELAEEITALKAVPRPDTEGIVLTLGSLAASLDTLPLRNSAPLSLRTEAPKPAAGLTGLDRAFAAIRRALGSLLQVRHTDDPVSPLLSEAEQTLLIRSLDLELQLARLAIMRGDAGMFRRSVQAARERLEQNFDPASPDVQSALGTLRELAATELPEELPDISGSLAALLKITGAGASR